MQNQPIITFRTVVDSDIPVIQDLSSRIWREHYPDIITHAQIDYMLGTMYASGVFHDEILNKGYRYVVVMMEKDAVGYFACGQGDGRGRASQGILEERSSGECVFLVHRSLTNVGVHAAAPVFSG